MNEEKQVEKNAVKVQNRTLVPIKNEQTKALVLNAIKSALAGTGRSIGVSRNWLIKHVDELSLKEGEVETLVLVRTEFRGLLPHAVKFLYKGLSVDDVWGCYRTQRLMAESGYSASVKKIAMLIFAFAEADPSNEGLGEMIVEAHKVISNRYFWVRYIDQSISILCAIAKEYGCATIDAALAMIESRHAKKDGMLPRDGEEDEVERHRAEYEIGRRSYY